MNLDELDTPDDDEEFEEMSEEELLTKLPEFKSIKLCDIIVAHRYLGFYKKLYVPCMQELAKRRIDGDSWDFEQYIDDQLKDMPKLNFNLNDLNSAMQQLRKMTGAK